MTPLRERYIEDMQLRGLAVTMHIVTAVTPTRQKAPKRL